jgi:hypothetical protein
MQNHRFFRFQPMSSIFSPILRGQKTSFFRCFSAPNSVQNHYMSWSNSTFSHPNHYASSELSLLRGWSLANCCQPTNLLFYVCGNSSTAFLRFRGMWEYFNSCSVCGNISITSIIQRGNYYVIFPCLSIY